MIGKHRSQLHGISKGGAQSRLPSDFTVKSGSQIYFITMMCHGKLCCVLDFGDFCFRIG